MFLDSRSRSKTVACASISSFASRFPQISTQVHQRFDRLALAEVVPERRSESLHIVVILEPVFEEPLRDVRRAGIAGFPPGVNLRADLWHEQQLARPAAGFVDAPAGGLAVVFDEKRRRL